MAEVFISLARKWRPRRLADMVGQEYVVRALQNAAQKNQLHHALLFSGTRGIGKTTLARIVAMLINCRAASEGAAAEPCLECDFCRDIMAGRLTDVIEQDAASHTQVDKMRDLLESAAYAPARAACKVFIIDEVHMLTKQSFNAMLKTLEEPPPHVKFILATTDPQKLPATVRSRCLCFSLLPLAPAQISGRLAHILNEEKIPFNPAATAAVARLAGGSMRDALSILDQAVAHRSGDLQAEDVRRITGDIGGELLAEVLRAVADGNAEKISALTEQHRQQHVSFDIALARLSALLYRIALAQAVPGAPLEDDSEADIIAEMGKRLTAEQLQVLYEITLRARQQLPHAPDAATGFAMALLRMTLFTPENAPASAAAAPPAAGAAAASNAPPPPAVVEGASAASPAASPRWEETRAQLGSMAKALAMHCIAESYSSSGITLRLDEAHSALKEKFQEQLAAELRQRHGADFAVNLQVGSGNAVSSQQHAQLVQEIHASGFVEKVQQVFPAAALVEDSAQRAEQ